MKWNSYKVLFYFYFKRLLEDKFLFILILIASIFMQSSWLVFNEDFRKILESVQQENVSNPAIFSLNNSLLLSLIFIIFITLSLGLRYVKFSLKKENILFFSCIGTKREIYSQSLWFFLILINCVILTLFLIISYLVVFFHNFIDSFMLKRILLVYLFGVLSMSFFMFGILISNEIMGVILFFLSLGMSLSIENISFNIWKSPWWLKIPFFAVYPFIPRFHQIAYFILCPDNMVFLQKYVIIQSICLITLLLVIINSRLKIYILNKLYE